LESLKEIQYKYKQSQTKHFIDIKENDIIKDDPNSNSKLSFPTKL
jgi:hypothetical protein